MKDRTKQTIADGFGGLVKNATALRGAKNGPLWLTIVMFFASILLPILPLFVSANGMSGSSFIKNNTYSLERYVTRAALDLKKSPNKYEISISEDHFLSVNKEGTEINYGSYDDHGKDADRTIAPFYTYTNKATGEYSFLLYVSDIDNAAEKVETTNAKGKTKLINAKTAYLTRIAQFTYESGTTTSYDLGNKDQKQAVEDAKKKDSTNPKTFYFPSYIVLFKDSFNVVCCYGEKAVAGSTNGAADYKKVSANANCLETLLTVKDKNGNDAIMFELYSKRGEVEMPVGYEADGVRKIIMYLKLIVSAFNQKSTTIAIDELDAGVFEYLLGEILELFQEHGKGQFIFTSHNLRPLEVLDKKFICFTTSNPSNRYIRMKGVGHSNNLRSLYFREILLANTQDEILYENEKKFKILGAFKQCQIDSEDADE